VTEDVEYLLPDDPTARLDDGGPKRLRYLVLPEVVVPLDQPLVFRYALGAWLLPPTRTKAARNAALSALVRSGHAPRFGRQVTVSARTTLTPRLVAAASDLGAGAVGGWLLSPGGSDALSRSVFHLFEPGAAKPHAVLKFARQRGYTDPFDRDERALRLAADAGGAVARHAPRLVARGEVDRRAVSVETAAPGPRLLSYLTSRAPRRDRAAALFRVARWTVDVGRETRAGGDAAPTVFAHNDLGPWNVLVDGTGHTAVDWESADPRGLPLADLVYLLFYGLANLDGHTPDEGWFRALFGGEVAASRMLFALVDECATASRVPDDLVGPLVTSTWQRHATSHVARREALDAHAAGAAAADTVMARCWRAWCADPRLGERWPARSAR
jgi:hypothetical protein